MNFPAINTPAFSRHAFAAGVGMFAAAAFVPIANAKPETQRPATEVAGDAPARAVNPDQRFCVVQRAVTGSHIDRKVCKTRSQWMADGFDPLAAPSQ